MSRIPLVLVAIAVGVAVGPLIRAQVCEALGDNERQPALTCPQCSIVVGRRRLWKLGPPVLRSGKCGGCGTRLGPPLGTIEVLGAATLGLLAITTDEILPLIAYGSVAAVGLALATVDVAVHRLPNKLTGLLIVGASLTLTLDAAVSDEWPRLAEAGASGVGACAFYTALSITTRGGIGLGDAKLAIGLGLAAGWTGWSTAAFAITLGFVLTGLAAIALLLFTRASRKDALPHGPFMVAATVAAIALANQL